MPHLIYRDGGGAQVIRTIAPGTDRITIGRSQESGVHLGWDSEVSRLHAELQCVGGDWTILDDGLSRNGTFVGGERLHGRRRLDDGDVVAVGQTAIVFRAPESELGRTATAVGSPVSGSVPVSAAERCVLVALCRPVEASASGLPATNQQIAEELHLSVPAVKKRLRSLFERFELEDLAQNEKRGQLAAAAIRMGVVVPGAL